MSHTFTKTTNKQQKHPKVHFDQYIYTDNELNDYDARDSHGEIEAELLENRFFARRRFRHVAQRIRTQYR